MTTSSIPNSVPIPLLQFLDKSLLNALTSILEFQDVEIKKAKEQLFRFEPGKVILNTQQLEDKNGYSFVLSNPVLEQYLGIEPFLQYFDYCLNGNGRAPVLILGGGTAQKELGLLMEYVYDKTASLENLPSFIVTDKFLKTDLIIKYLTNLANILAIPTKQLDNLLNRLSYFELDISNESELKRVIREIKPGFITLLSVLTIFEGDIQQSVVQTLADVLPNTKILYGAVGPTGIQGMYKRPIELITKNISASILEYAYEQGYTSSDSAVTSYLQELQMFNMSNFISDYGYAPQIPFEYSGFAKYNRKLFNNVGFKEDAFDRGNGWHAISNGFKSKAVPTYYTFLFSKI